MITRQSATSAARSGRFAASDSPAIFPALAGCLASRSSCARRERSNTPLQALTLLNDPVFFECAQTLGKRMAQTPATSIDDRIRRAFVTCLARQPSEAELDRLRQFHARQLELLARNPESSARIAGETDAADLKEKAVFAALCRVIMNLDEFVTRE